MSVIGNVIIGLQANTSGLDKGLKKGGKSVNRFGSSVGGSTKALGGFALKMAGAVVAAAGLYTVIKNVNDQFSKIDKIAKFADTVGLTVDEMRGLQHAAALTGNDTATLEKGLQRMVRRVGEAKMGLGAGKKALEEMGLSADELSQMSTADILYEVSDAIAAQPDAASQAAKAYALFGRQGQELQVMLTSGSGAIKDMIDENTRLQGSMSRFDASKVEMYNDAMQRLGVFLEGVWQQMAINIAPILTAIVGKFTEAGAGSLDFGQMVITAMDWGVEAIAMGADILDVLGDGWNFLKAIVSTAVAGILTYYGYIGKGLQELINLLPGVEVTFGDTMQSMADSAQQLAEGDWKKAKEEFIKAPPSEGVKKWFDDVKAESKRAFEEMQQNSFAKAQLEGLAEAQKPAIDLINKYREQLEVFGMSSREAEIFKLKQEGISGELIKQAEALDHQLTAMDEQSKLQETLESRAASLTESVQTPLEEFQKKLMELNQVKDLISPETFARVKEKLKGELMGAMPEEGELKFAGALELGSNEARQAIIRNRFQLPNKNDPLKQLDDTNKKQLDVQKQMLVAIQSQSGGEEIIDF